MQSTIDSVDLQMLSAYEFNKLPALVRTELLESDKLGVEVRRRSRLVSGVGTNDAGYYVSAYLQGTLVMCPAYTVWQHMLTRCYSGKYQKQYPTYIGCSVCVEWLSFTTFRLWWLENHVDGWELDKDLLVAGNMVYSPQTCVFVPKWLNSFTTSSKSIRGALPIGVRLHTRSKVNPYHAQCSNGSGSQIHLGCYPTPEAAYAAWLKYKLGMVDSMQTQLEGILPGLTEKVRTKIMSLR